MDDADIGSRDYCHLTTVGRVSGAPHTIEIWFAMHGDRVYVLSGGGERSDWVRNIRRDPRVGLRIGDRDMICQAEVVTDREEDTLARRLLIEKYRPRYRGDLANWGATALPIAITLPSQSERG